MALSGSRLQGTILAAIQAAFPVNVSLLPNEKSAINTGQSAFAGALANPTVTEIVTNETNLPGSFAINPANIIAPSGGGACTGSGAVTGTGTAS